MEADEQESGELVELLPCPFCGEPGMINSNEFSHYKGFQARCSVCECQMGVVDCNCPYDSKFPYDTKEEAAAAWNRRA